jgi:hypothetical protein
VKKSYLDLDMKNAVDDDPHANKLWRLKFVNLINIPIYMKRHTATVHDYRYLSDQGTPNERLTYNVSVPS